MSDAAHRRRSAWPLIIGFTVLAVLIAAAGYWAWLQQSRSTQRQAERSLVAVGQLKAGQIAAWLKKTQDDAEIIHGDPLLSAAAADMLLGGNAGSATAGVQTYLDNYQRNYGYKAVVMTSPNGAILLSAPSPSPDALGAEAKALVTKAAATGRVESTDLYLDAEGNALLDMAAPVLDADGGVIAAVILRSDLDRVLYPLIQHWPLPSKSGETLLVERRGDRVVFLNELRFRKNAALKLTLPLSRTDVPAVMAVRGRRGVFDGIDYRGVPVLSAIQPVPGTPWFIVAKDDTGEVLGATRTRGWLTAGFTLLLVLLAGAATLLLWRARESQASAEIHESEAKFRTLFESMTEGVALHELTVDAQGAPLDYRILDLNPAYETQTGISADQARGRLSRDAYGAPEPPFLAEYAHTAQSGEPLRVQTYFEPLAKHFDITVVAQGEGRFATVFEDITERKRAEEALQESQDLLTRAERLGRIGGWEFDIETKQQTWTETVYDIHEVESSSRPTVDQGENYYTPASRPIIEQAVQRAIEQGEPFDLELEIITAKGNLRSVHAIGEADLARRRVSGFIQDITDRKQAEEKLREAERTLASLNADLEQRVLDRTAQLDAANKELEAFAYSVSHDLRAPLRHISGFSELLAARSADVLDDRGRHYLETITASVGQMGVLIDDLLQFSRTGRTELQIAEVDMQEVLREALESLQHETAGREIEWSIGALPAVVGDHALLRQVWANLLGNAVKYSRGRTPARLEVGFREGDEADNGVFWVRDNGVGFDMKYAHKLFGVFQRLHTAAEFEGTGIGLANVQRIINRLGGRVWAEAEIDKGAVFCFSLPRRRETPS